MTARRSLRADGVGSWLLKSTVPPSVLSPGWVCGEERILTRCLRRSYRLQLMVPGQPCVLWVSGPQAGVHAVGALVSPPADGPAPGSQATVDVALRLLPEPVPRAVLRADTALAGAEVLRMPAGSNPSYLTPSQATVLLRLAGSCPSAIRC